MLSSSEPAAPILPAMSLDATPDNATTTLARLALGPDNAMTALSRLALGPVNTDYYLAVFERFDDAGRTRTTWNWAACLFTLNWMVFRKIWGAALVYVAAAEGLALVVFGLGRSFLQWPQGVEWGVLGTVALMAFVVPGLYGDAILHADIRKRVARALAASRTVPEACVLLEKQASSRRRLQALVLINMMLAGAAALLYLALPLNSAKPLEMEPSLTVAQTTAAATAAAAAAAAAAASSTTTTSAAPTIAPSAAPQASTVVPKASEAAADKPGPPTNSGAVTPAPLSAPLSAPAPAFASEPRPKIASLSTSAQPQSAPTVSKSATPKPAASGAASTASNSRPALDGPAKNTEAPTRSKAAERRPVTAVKSKTLVRAAPATPAPAPASATSKTQPQGATVGAAPGYYINVGLFADEANARKAQAQLLNEGFPAFRQELHNSQGRRIRVRAGPYESRAQADGAAKAIRTLALDAVVFKK